MSNNDGYRPKMACRPLFMVKGAKLIKWNGTMVRVKVVVLYLGLTSKPSTNE